jgi:hypothetical protein
MPTIKMTAEIRGMLYNTQKIKKSFQDKVFNLKHTFESRSEHWRENEKGGECKENIESMSEIVKQADGLYAMISELYEEGV